MSRNMGNTDRVLRFIIATLIGVLYINGIITGKLGIYLMLLAGIFIFNSCISFCSFYALFGFSSCPVDKKKTS